MNSFNVSLHSFELDCSEEEHFTFDSNIFLIGKHREKVQDITMKAHKRSTSTLDQLNFVLVGTTKTRFEKEDKSDDDFYRGINLFFSRNKQINCNDFVNLCAKHPYKCKRYDRQGRSFLHHLVQRQPSVLSVSTVLDIAPDTIMKQDCDGSTPIHLAVINGASHQVIQYLIDICPETVKVENRWGYSASSFLFDRCIVELSYMKCPHYRANIWKTVEALLKAIVRTDLGRVGPSISLLHMATDFACPIGILTEILKDFPAMTRYRDEKGRIPLARAYVAPAHIVTPQFLQTMIEFDPTMLLEQDYDGRIPLHLAIAFNREWDMVIYMIQQSPDSIRIPDGMTGLYPFMMLCNKSWASLSHLHDTISLCTDVFNHYQVARKQMT